MSDQRIPRFISNQPQFESDGLAAVLQLGSGCDMAVLVDGCVSGCNYGYVSGCDYGYVGGCILSACVIGSLVQR